MAETWKSVIQFNALNFIYHENEGRNMDLQGHITS